MKLIILLAVSFLGFPLHAEPFDASVTTEIERFQSEFSVNEHAQGGLVIGIIDETGSRVFVCEPESKTGAHNSNTVFELGSVTKVFTALIAFELERKGTWTLADPVAIHLPKDVSVPTYDDIPIRIENLARQDSGLPWHPHEVTKNEDGQLDLPELRRVSEAFAVDNLYNFLKTFKLSQKPGSSFGYSNVGMGLLGCAAENASGMSYEALVEEQAAAPLGMTSTRVRLNSELRSRLVPGHWQSGAPSENVNLKAMAGAGQMFSTVDDLLKFVSANLGFTDSALNPSLRAMQKTQHEGSHRFGNTAAPWMTDRVFQPAGSRLIGHGGGGFGYLAFIGMDTIQKRGVVVLSNQMVVNSSGIGWAILQQMPMTPSNLSLFVKPYVGVGFSIARQSDSSLIIVSRVFIDSPAEKLGVPEKSVIKSINGTSVSGKGLSGCLKLLDGKEGDTIVLDVLLPDQNSVKTFKIPCGPFLTATALPKKESG